MEQIVVKNRKNAVIFRQIVFHQMWRIISILLYNTLIFISICFAQQPDTLIVFDNQKVTNAFIRNYYLSTNTKQYLDDYQEFVIYQIETTGNYSLIDPYFFSINGNSYKWNKYYFNNHRINDIYFCGNALHQLSLFDNSLQIDGCNTGLYFKGDSESIRIFEMSWNHGGLGGPAPFSENLIHLYHRTARENMYTNILHQRKINDAYSFQLKSAYQFKNESYPITISLDKGSRLFPDFNEFGLKSVYPENYLKFYSVAELPLGNERDAKTYLMFSALRRTNLFAENYYNKNETAGLNSYSASIFRNRVKPRNNRNGGINLSLKQINHQDATFSRNIIDQDGEGFEPWYPDATVFEISYANKMEYLLRQNVFFHCDMFNGMIFQKPLKTNSFNAIYKSGWDSLFTPLYVYEWQMEPFVGTLHENTTGIFVKKSTKNSFFTYKSGVDLTADGFYIGANSLLSVNWQFNADFLVKFFRWFELSVHIGKKRIPYHFDQMKFLSNKYMSGNVFFWNDANNNQQYEEIEKGDLYTTSGGKFHALANDIKQPSYVYLEIPLKLIVGKKSSIGFYPFYKQFSNLWTVEYVNDASAIGMLEAFDDKLVFFLKPGEVTYKVTNNSELNNSYGYFERQSFAKGYTIKYQKSGTKLFFSISWTAYMVVGKGALGNGLLHNNLDVLSESQANLNTRINAIGRMDSDRAYIGRMLLSYRSNKNLVLAFQLKYKDGQPFSCFEPYTYQDESGNTQVQIQSYFPKADNPMTGERGYRKDAFFNTELRIAYNLKIMKRNFVANLTLYNIYDFGTELAEYTFFPPEKERYSMELNIPRGIQLSIQMPF
jgi:hypothetical protein